MGPEVKAKISAAGLNHFLTSIYNDGIVEHKDINLIIALSERFWDTTNTFHFPGIGEVMLTPQDFAVITGLRIGGERIEVNDNLTNCDVERLLGGLPPKGSELNVKLSWLVKHLRGIEDVEMCVRSFMLLLIGQVLSPNTGSTVSLRYLASLENVDDIGKYDWGGMTYATLLHYMVQYSRCAMNNFGGPLFTWEVNFGFLKFLCSKFGKFELDVVVFCVLCFRFGCMSTLGLVLSFIILRLRSFQDFFVGLPGIGLVGARSVHYKIGD